MCYNNTDEPLQAKTKTIGESKKQVTQDKWQWCNDECRLRALRGERCCFVGLIKMKDGDGGVRRHEINPLILTL